MSSPEDSLEKKIDVILEAIQNFGLNFIQKIGELQHSISILTDQMEKMSKSLITIKGMEPKIDELSTMKQDILTEIHLLQSQIKSSSFRNNNNIIKMEIDHSSEDLVGELQVFKEKLSSYSGISNLVEDFENLKKKIYESTGGHRILYDIMETIKEIQKLTDVSQMDIPKIEEKITFWMNKL
jgi:hypothetical protein